MGLPSFFRLIAVGGHDELAFRPGLDAVLLHEFANSVFAHTDASGQQFLVHAWPAVFALDLLAPIQN